MEVNITLNRSDIASIIAEKYGVLLSDVFVEAKQESVGYGMAERVEYQTVATIRIRNVTAENIAGMLSDGLEAFARKG